MSDLNSIPYLTIGGSDHVSKYKNDLIEILNNDMSLNDISTNIMNINGAFNDYLESRDELNTDTKTDLDNQLLLSYKSNMDALNNLNQQRYEKHNKMRNIMTSLKNEKGYLEIQKDILIGTTDPNSNYLGEIENTLIKIENVENNLENSKRNLEIKDYYEKKITKQNSVLKYAILLVSLLLGLSIVYNSGLMSDTLYFILIGLIIAYMIIYIFIEMIDIMWRDNKYFDEYNFGGSPNRGLSDLEKGIVSSEDDDDELEYCDDEEESSS